MTSIYIHQSHLFCECSEKKSMGKHVCPACWESAPESLRKTIDAVSPGCLRHIAAVAVLLAHARHRHPAISILYHCPRCNRCQIPDKEWRVMPGCFSLKAGWELQHTICPDCATDQETATA